MPDFILLLLIYIFVLYKRWKCNGKERLVVNSIMYIYICFVLYFTLMPIVTSIPSIFSHPYVSMNMIPFDDYINGRGDTVRQILLNILMMIPFGFMYPIVKEGKSNILKTILATFVFSLCIELFQPLINGWRASDITDLITNTLGGMLGYLFYVICKPLINSILRHLSNRM